MNWYYHYIRQIWAKNAEFNNDFGQLNGELDLLPKPQNGRFPMLVTGSSQQDNTWLAEHGDGWLLYPRAVALQRDIIQTWRQRTLDAGRSVRPAMQPLYVDLQQDKEAPMVPIHLGFSTGDNGLKDYLFRLEAIGINHVALNLRFNQSPIEETLQMLATDILPLFNSQFAEEQ